MTGKGVFKTMTDETKGILGLQISMLKETMNEEKLIFGIVVDKNDYNKSSLAFIDKKKYVECGKTEGVFLTLDEIIEKQTPKKSTREMRVSVGTLGLPYYENICPVCDAVIDDAEYMYCPNCGQKLLIG